MNSLKRGRGNQNAESAQQQGSKAEQNRTQHGDETRRVNKLSTRAHRGGSNENKIWRCLVTARPLLMQNASQEVATKKPIRQFKHYWILPPIFSIFRWHLYCAGLKRWTLHQQLFPFSCKFSCQPARRHRNLSKSETMPWHFAGRRKRRNATRRK